MSHPYLHWDNQPPPPTQWPYWWSPEYDIAVPTRCICDGSWVPLPDETWVKCPFCGALSE